MSLPPTNPQILIDREKINEPGDVITESIIVHKDTGESYNISNFAYETILHEDIFSNVLTGHVLVLDSADLISLIPFMGTETITLSFRTPGFKEKISKTFKITAIEERKFVSTDREQSYVISFISKEGFFDNITNLSKKFSGSTDVIVKKMYEEYLKTKRLDGEVGNLATSLVMSNKAHGSSVSFVACSWSPFKCINWVAGRSFTTATSAPSFLFFESNKAFYFTSIESMVSKQKDNNEVFGEYIYSPVFSVISNPKKSKFLYVKPELTKQYSLVKSISPISQFNLLDGQDRGYYAGTLITHDRTLKVYKEHPFDYRGIYQNFEHLGKNPQPPFPKSVLRNPKVKNTVRTKAYQLHNDMKDPLYEKWMLQRNSLLLEATNFRIKIEVAGRTDIEVGKLINFLYPKAIDKNNGDQAENTFDSFVSGVYLITAIRHSFSLNKHIMHLELMKDSFQSQV